MDDVGRFGLGAVAAREVECVRGHVGRIEELARLAAIRKAIDLERVERCEVIARDLDHLGLALREVDAPLPGEGRPLRKFE